MYGPNTLDEMSSSRIWVELGLHKGALGEDETNTYFYIGDANMVGVVVRGGYRVSLEAARYVTSEWFHRLPGMNPNEPWQGPVCRSGATNEILTMFNKLVTPAREYLNKKLGTAVPKKPKLKFKPKTIAYEDRPDVGRDTTAPRKLKLRNRPA